MDSDKTEAAVELQNLDIAEIQKDKEQEQQKQLNHSDWIPDFDVIEIASDAIDAVGDFIGDIDLSF